MCLSLRVTILASTTEMKPVLTSQCTVVASVWSLVPAQDVHFFYTSSHLSAIQNCALIFSTNFQFIFTFKECTTPFSH